MSSTAHEDGDPDMLQVRVALTSRYGGQLRGIQAMNIAFEVSCICAPAPVGLLLGAYLRELQSTLRQTGCYSARPENPLPPLRLD